MESTLHNSGAVAETVEKLEKAGYTYEKDGAIWLKNTDLGADKDEVLRRANGFYTYYAVDIAYHMNKFLERGFDRVIDVWGADHHGHAIRFKATCAAPSLGMNADKLDFLIMQMVRLVRDGETIKVSKRTGKALTLNDLLDEISVDACRFFFNAKPDTHLEFDLGLAVRQDSENPVYYVQYAHARICSLIKMLAEEGINVPAAESVDMTAITSDAERELIKQISLLPEVIGEWQALCREADRVIKATVSSAEVLTDLQKTQLEEKLSRRLGGRIEAEYRVDPSLLGGIRVETDDSVLDGSLIGRLSVWKDVMKQ